MGLSRCWVYKNPLPTIINYCFDRKFHFFVPNKLQARKATSPDCRCVFIWLVKCPGYSLNHMTQAGESWKMQGTTFWWSEGILLNLLLLDMPLVSLSNVYYYLLLILLQINVLLGTSTRIFYRTPKNLWWPTKSFKISLKFICFSS